MKVLFISSGNSGDISPIIKNQGDSIIKYDPSISIEYLLINGKGLIGYLKNIPAIRQRVKLYKPNIIHTHYSFCGILSVLAIVNIPIIASLMGSDVKVGKYYNFIIRIFSKLFWKQTIVKSEDSRRSIKIPNTLIIPNGVDLDKFYPINKETARIKLNWDLESKILLFAANPLRPEKNWQLAKNAINNTDFKIDVKFLNEVPNGEVVYHYNAADVVVLTSLWEGSPNVIKESMACNRSIVSTNIGDVKWVFGNTIGCFIANFKKEDVTEKINRALTYDQKTNGRERIIELGLDAETIANKIIDIYKESIKRA